MTLKMLDNQHVFLYNFNDQKSMETIIRAHILHENQISDNNKDNDYAFYIINLKHIQNIMQANQNQ